MYIDSGATIFLLIFVKQNNKKEGFFTFLVEDNQNREKRECPGISEGAVAAIRDAHKLLHRGAGSASYANKTDSVAHSAVACLETGLDTAQTTAALLNCPCHE